MKKMTVAAQGALICSIFLILVSILPSSIFAATFTRQLDIGTRGPDVTDLQQLLNEQGYLNVNPTGYFGFLTAQAVAWFQTVHGLDAVGRVGPLTLAALNAIASPSCLYGRTLGGWCADAPLTFSATPLSGKAPVAVSFTVSGGVAGTTIDYGDGATTTCSSVACSTIHTYMEPGTYTAIYALQSQCPRNSLCQLPAAPTVIITVTANTPTKP